MIFDGELNINKYLEKLKQLGEYSSSPELIDEEADEFLTKMFFAKPTERGQAFLKKAKDYANAHPIREHVEFRTSSFYDSIMLCKPDFRIIDEEILEQHDIARQVIFNCEMNMKEWNKMCILNIREEEKI